MGNVFYESPGVLMPLLHGRSGQFRKDLIFCVPMGKSKSGQGSIRWAAGSEATDVNPQRTFHRGDNRLVGE